MARIGGNPEGRGPSDGLVRDLSYCEANLGRDDFRSGVTSGWCSRTGPGGGGMRKDTDYGAQITRRKTATLTRLLNQVLRSADEASFFCE